MNPIARTVPVAAVALLSLAVAPPDDLDTFIQTQMAARDQWAVTRDHPKRKDQRAGVRRDES